MFAGFIGISVGSLGRAQWSPGLLMFAWVHSARPCSPGSFGFAWVHSGAPRCRRVHSGSPVFTLAQRLVHYRSREFTQARLGVAWFILVLLGSLCAPSALRVDSGLRGFTRMRQ